VQKRKLGKSKLEVSALGFGCMGLNFSYGHALSKEEGVTGLMKAFFKLGDIELSEQAIGGGIAEALIATASGLFIAVLSLIALNYFAAKLAEFQFELQTAATNAEVLVGSAVAKEKESQKETFAYETRLSAAA
jgi:biopolymer transport protein ExbB